MGGIPLRLSASCLCFVVKTSTLRTSQQSTFASIPQYEQILLRFKTCHNCETTFFFSLSFWYSIFVSFLFIAYDLLMNILKNKNPTEWDHFWFKATCNQKSTPTSVEHWFCWFKLLPNFFIWSLYKKLFYYVKLIIF